MSVEIVMPKLSDTMEEGTILRWLKKEGEAINAGEPIAEVETDKADMELEAAESGVLKEIKVKEGETAGVGAVLALVDENGAREAAGSSKETPRAAGERGSDAAARPAEERAGRAEDETPPEAGEAKRPEAKGARAPAVQKTGAADTDGESGESQESGRSEERPSTASRGAVPRAAREGDDRQRREWQAAPASRRGPSAEDPARTGEPVKASPVARKVAAERGIDLRSIRGSGPDGRIVKEDVEAAGATPRRGAEAATPSRADATSRAEREPQDDTGTRRDARSRPGAAAEPPVAERRELSRMRQSIAKRMSESFRDVPHFYVTAEIDMTEAARLKEALQASELFASPITYTHMVLKATALALRRHPRLNASYRDGAIETKAEINLGMAVAVEDGLIVPILRRVDELPLGEIAAESRRLVEHAQQGRFASEDLSGGTFTISNMGMLDIEDFAAVINPPQAAILAVGAIKERPVVRDGAIVPARTMRVTLSCDHRIIDGVVAGRFLEELKRLLENPVVLVVREQ